MNTRKPKNTLIISIALFLVLTAGYYIGYTEATRTAKDFYSHRISKLTNAYNGLILTYELDEMNSLTRILLTSYQETVEGYNQSKTLNYTIQRMNYLVGEMNKSISKLSCSAPEEKLVSEKIYSIRNYVSELSNYDNIPFLVEKINEEITSLVTIIENCNTS